MTFSERIDLRRRLWWAKPGKWRRWTTYRHPWHRFVETHRLKHRDDAEDRWRCCDYWQRSLSNKWNSREFAARHHCQIPELYWFGREIGALPVDRLPAHFVIRPAWGAARRGVHVIAGDRDLLHDKPCERANLIHVLQQERGRYSRFPLLVEEFVKTPDDEDVLPVEYKFFAFGSTIGVVQVGRRSRPPSRHRFYLPPWEPIDDQMNTGYPLDEITSPPACYGNMLALARTLGSAWGTFVRVDFYATNRGCVFSEFASTPWNGRGFTPFADAHLGELWDRLIPDRT